MPSDRLRKFAVLLLQRDGDLIWNETIEAFCCNPILSELGMAQGNEERVMNEIT